MSETQQPTPDTTQQPTETFQQTFERVTSKENTSDKVVLVDFYAE